MSPHAARVHGGGRLPARLRAEAGATIIEVVVVLMIAAAIVGALAALFVTSHDSSLASQRQISLLSVAQQQIEKLRQVVAQYGVSALALTGSPAAPSDSPLPDSPTDPNDFITGFGTSAQAFLIETNYNRTSEGAVSNAPLLGEPMLINGSNGVSGGQLAPVVYVDAANGQQYSSLGAVPTADALATVTVNTYVTQTAAAGCNTLLGSCGNDARRVIVAARLTNPGGRRDVGRSTPTYTTTVFVNHIPSNQPSNANGLRIFGLIP